MENESEESEYHGKEEQEAVLPEMTPDSDYISME